MPDLTHLKPGDKIAINNRVKYKGLGKTYTAPAMYRADAKAFYSVEFSGVPEKEVVVLRKA